MISAEGEEEVVIRSCSSSTSTNKTLLCFNDSVTADVELHLHLYDDESNTDVFDPNDVRLYLHSDVLRRRSKYFSALLSDRWQSEEGEGEGSSSSRRIFNLTHKVPASMKSIDTHRIVIELLYSTNDDNFSETINTMSSALSIIHVAMEFMFEDCVKACIRLIEALPWTEEEEERVVLDLIPLLKEDESQELLFRVVSPVKFGDSSDEMLLRLIKELRHNPHQKDFVAMMLRDYSSTRDSVIRLITLLDQEFEMTLKSLKKALQSACSITRRRKTSAFFWAPNEKTRRRNHMLRTITTIWEEEEEKTVAQCGGYLCCLVDMMIEWRVADTTTLYKWIDQEEEEEEEGSLPTNLQKAYSDTLISPEFLFNVILCTWKFANAVATGSIVADTQVRIRLLKDWLPVVLRVKDMVLQFLPELNHCFEKPFYKIISTLPMSESKVLLLQCLGFSTQDVCPHLVAAYKTWFKQAATQPPRDSESAPPAHDCDDKQLLDNEEILSNVVNHQQPSLLIDKKDSQPIDKEFALGDKEDPQPIDFSSPYYHHYTICSHEIDKKDI